MKQFIKTATGKQSIGQSLIKVYDSVEEVEQAIANGELQEGETFATSFIGEGDITMKLQDFADLLAATVEGLEERFDDYETKTEAAQAHSAINNKFSSSVSSSNQALSRSEITALIPTFSLDTTTSTLTITLGA